DVAVVRRILDGALFFPDGLAASLVKSHDILLVVPVKKQEHVLPENNRRRARSAMVVAGEIAAEPQDLARCRVQAAGAVAAEMDVEPAFFDHRRRAGVAVIWMTIRRLRVGENLDVVDDIPRVAIDTYREELLAVGASGGHPNLIAPDDGR